MYGLVCYVDLLVYHGVMRRGRQRLPRTVAGFGGKGLVLQVGYSHIRFRLVSISVHLSTSICLKEVALVSCPALLIQHGCIR